MKKKLFSGLLIVCLLFGIMALPIQASTSFENGDSIYDPVQVQDLTGPKFSDIIVRNYHHDLIYYTLDEKWGVMDVYGNAVLPPVYDGFKYIGDDYYTVGKDGGCALFYGVQQLTPFSYKGIEKMACCFKMTLPDGTLEFRDHNINKVSVPTVGDAKWSVIEIIPYKAILLYKEENIWFDIEHGGIPYPSRFYRLLDWKGQLIAESKIDGGEIIIRDDNSFTIEVNSYTSEKELKYIDESLAPKSCPKGYAHVKDEHYANSQYHLLYKTDGSNTVYYLYDTDYNEICKLDTSSDFGTPVHSVSDTLFVVMNSAGNSVLMNSQGQEVSILPGWFRTLAGISAYADPDSPYDRFIMGDGENSYLYDKIGHQLAVLEGAKLCEVKDGYIVADLGDQKYALYDLEGNFLFSYDSYSKIHIAHGIIMQKNDNGWAAVLDREGNRLTDYIFGLCQRVGTLGLMYVRIRGGEHAKYFLVNNQGQILNEEGFDEWPQDCGEYCEYKIGGKTGFLRIVYPGDEVFTDVPYGTWYYDSVETCAELELFNGTAPAKFSPEKTMTRAMLVTVLWRLDGEKTPNEPADFTDVSSGIWYADAVAWAAENGIVNGTGKGKFDPEGNVTREQIATILRRYAESKGIDTDAQADLSAYPDAEEISSYAKDAMAWANAAGLINGNKMGQTVFLQPKGNATRAQVAAILIRYINNLIHTAED